MSSPFESIVALIQSHLQDAKVEVIDMTGTRDHLDIQVISDAFVGKRLIQKHQMLMDILKERLAQDVHAVKLKTLTYEEAEKLGLK
jgi:stress-induced morphogen